MTAPGNDIANTALGRLRQLVSDAREKALDALGRRDKLVFSREGLRIFQRTGGGYRVIEEPGYDGVDPTWYVEALAEREIELEAIGRIEAMTDAERAEALREHDRHLEALRSQEDE